MAQILVAEDDTSVSELAKTILEDFGYTVLTAKDGEDAIRQFEAHREKIDLLILDVIMPKSNGRQVYEKVKELKPGVKAIFTSGYTSNVIHHKGRLDPDLSFVPKPVAPNQLLRVVREVLDS